jgi:hypothetical protein
VTKPPSYEDPLLSAPLHSRARTSLCFSPPPALAPFVSPTPTSPSDGAGPPLFATDSSYCKSEMSLIWIFGFYFDCMAGRTTMVFFLKLFPLLKYATILHGPRHNRCHTFPVRIIIDPWTLLFYAIICNEGFSGEFACYCWLLSPLCSLHPCVMACK